MVGKNMNESKPRDNAPEEISKSQRRRDALEIRALAARLIALSQAQLAQVPLDDQLRAEIEQARRIRSNVARKRQLQFVAKLMRRSDPTEIQAALEAFDQEARQLTARQHRSEAWRDHLLAAGDAAIGELLQKRRDADAQALRQLVRNAQREARADRPPAAARALFRELRALDEAEPLPPPAVD
jgi:ribosome-associated protein